MRFLVAADTWCAELHKQAAHLFAPPPASAPQAQTAEIPAWLPATDRLTLARHSAPPVVKQRPVSLEVPPEVGKTWEHLAPHERLTAYREWRDAQPS
jgi:hypothetical protein